MPKTIDLTGQKFGKLLVLEQVEDYVSPKGQHSKCWKCKCDCGNIKNIVGSKLKLGHTKSCGCLIDKTSFPEQALYYYIKQIFPDAINTDKHLGIELDIYIPSLDVAIEYDGEAWHNKDRTIKIDLRKNQLCIDNNIELIRIREPKCVSIGDCTIFNREDSISNLSLNIVISDILRYLTSSISIDVNTTRDTPMILSQFATKKYKNSLAYCYPDIAKEWHPTKNGTLTPDKITKNSEKIVWWLGKCGHEYQTKIISRINASSTGCPYCGHRKILIGFNDLQSQYPNIAKDWHPYKNGDLKPTDVMSKSDKTVWWKCNKCGYEWQAKIGWRTANNGQGCKRCYYKRKSCPIICIETNTKFENAVLASKFINAKTTSNIYGCCRGKQKTAGGYHWKFADDNKNEALIS